MLQEGTLCANACKDARGVFHFGNPYLSLLCFHLESLVHFQHKCIQCQLLYSSCYDGQISLSCSEDMENVKDFESIQRSHVNLNNCFRSIRVFHLQNQGSKLTGPGRKALVIEDQFCFTALSVSRWHENDPELKICQGLLPERIKGFRKCIWVSVSVILLDCIILNSFHSLFCI